MSEEQLRKELEEAKQLIKLLKEEVGFAERGYTQKGWVKTYCGGKPNYTTPKEWVGLTDEEREFFKGIGFVGVDIIEAKLKEKNT